MTSFMLKIIGIICMLCDHIGYFFLKKTPFFNYIGRIAFPIFAFQSVQSYMYTKNVKKHLIKLLIFALISQIPYTLFLYSILGTVESNLNVLFTFLLGNIALIIYDTITDKNKKNFAFKFCGFSFVLLISVLAQIFKVDYGWYGILLIFFFYIFKDSKVGYCISTIILTIFKYVPTILSAGCINKIHILSIFYTCLSLIFILAYNQKEGKKTKYVFYIFYPLHLLIIAVIMILLNKMGI